MFIVPLPFFIKILIWVAWPKATELSVPLELNLLILINLFLYSSTLYIEESWNRVVSMASLNMYTSPGLGLVFSFRNLFSCIISLNT